MSDPPRPDLAPYAGHMAKAELAVGLRFEGAVVRPGDTLVLIAPDATREWVAQVKAECDEYLPGVKVAVVNAAAQALVYRPNTDPDLAWPLKSKDAA